jgi:hypothetical protein
MKIALILETRHSRIAFWLLPTRWRQVVMTTKESLEYLTVRQHIKKRRAAQAKISYLGHPLLQLACTRCVCN